MSLVKDSQSASISTRFLFRDVTSILRDLGKTLKILIKFGVCSCVCKSINEHISHIFTGEKTEALKVK